MSFPERLRDESLLYLKALEQRSSAQRFPAQKYWMVIPGMLVRSAPANTIAGNSFLEDVLWGQYCIFLFVRIHDDLLDGHVHGRGLRAAADLVLQEGKRAFARHFDVRSPFWTSFRILLARTQDGIVAGDLLQRKRRPAHLLLRHYTKVSSIFRIGLAAVCIRCDRRNQSERLGRCFDALAVAGQILDDLEDVGEDLRRRRFNYVVSTITRRSRPGRRSRDLELQVARALLYGDGTARIMHSVVRHLHRAEEELRGLRLPEVRRYLRTQILTVSLLSHSLQSRWTSR